MSNMQTPLKKVRGLGAAKSGTEHFWQQRVTAIANVPLVLFLIWFVISHLGAARADVVASLKNPIISVLMILALASIFWHMRLGMQVIIEDYVHGHGRKLAAVIANTAFVAVIFGIAVYSILKMSFGL
jgi:succinate dehydrogenase / fumarate reductase, membrane anchor subunit